VFDARAAAVVRAWPGTDLGRAWSSAFIPLEPLTVLPPGSEAAYPDAYSWSFVHDAPEPPPGPARARITFADHGSLTVAVEDAADADQQMRHTDNPACATPPARSDACGITIAAIRYGRTTILTNRGEASVPAWILTTKQLTSPIALVAVDPSALTLPATAAVKGQYIKTIDGRRVTYTALTGSCDTDIRPLVYETALAVVVGVSAVEPPRCATRSATSRR
jgi:hypothetical protein